MTCSCFVDHFNFKRSCIILQISSTTWYDNNIEKVAVRNENLELRLVLPEYSQSMEKKLHREECVKCMKLYMA